MQGPAPSKPLLGDASAFADAPHWARPLIEGQLAALTELAEIGLEVARAIRRQATAEADAFDTPEATPKIIEGDLGLAYFRVSRAVRMTLALQSKVMEELRRQERIEAGLEEVAARRLAESARRDGRARSLLSHIRKESIEGVVWRVAVGDAEGAEAAETAERCADEASERLDDRDVYGDLLSRPMSEIVAQICRDLGLNPDWTRLAREAWAREEMDGAAVGSPLATQAANLAAQSAAPSQARPWPPSRTTPAAPPDRRTLQAASP